MRQPNYYSVLPAHIRYSEVLSDFEKILYSEIVALSNAIGYCYASNNYFAKVYNKSTRTISQAISNLAKYDYIKIHIDKENGNKRRIYVVLENYFKMMELSKKQRDSIYRELELNNMELERGIEENIKGIEENINSSREENFQYNNTSINTYINNINKREEVNIAELFNRIMSRSKRK